jgi:predicted nucleic acid-binding protein
MQTELVLVDTSAWLLALRKDFLPVVKDRIESLLKEDAILTTGIVKLELLGGARTEKEFQRLKARLDGLDTIETDFSVWDKACDLAFKLRRKGLTIPYTDILIAGCALSENATVLHADAHFDLIQKHTALNVESCVKAVKKADSQPGR